MGAQHTLGDVGEEGCSFPMGQHAFHQLCNETQEWGCSPQALGREEVPTLKCQQSTEPDKPPCSLSPGKRPSSCKPGVQGPASLTCRKAKWEPSLLSQQPPPIPNQSQTLCIGPLP